MQEELGSESRGSILGDLFIHLYHLDQADLLIQVKVREMLTYFVVVAQLVH